MFITSLRVKDEAVNARHTLLGSYRMLREHNHFGVLASMRYAIWLVYGNEKMPPGEFRVWAMRQVREHPIATCAFLDIWAFAIIVFIAWTVTR